MESIHAAVFTALAGDAEARVDGRIGGIA